MKKIMKKIKETFDILLPYCFICTLLTAFIFLFDYQRKSPDHFNDRSIASDCSESMKLFFDKKFETKTSSAIADYQKRTKTWYDFNDIHELQKFEIQEYKNAYHYYLKNNDQTSFKNPESLEEKLAFIEVLTLKLNLLSKTQNSLEELNLRQIKKLNALFKKYDFSHPLYRNKMHDFTAEFYAVLYGSPKAMKDLFKTANIDYEVRVIRLLEENLLTNGLEGMIQKIPLRQNIKTIHKARLLLEKLFKYRLIQLAAFLPYYLPNLAPIVIEEKLFKKILLEGIDKHEKELKAVFKRQNRADDYNNFRKVYTPIAYSIGIYVYYNIITDKVVPYLDEKIDQEKVKKELQSLVKSNS